MSTDMQTPEVGNSENDGLLQEWKERAEKAEADTWHWIAECAKESATARWADLWYMTIRQIEYAEIHLGQQYLGTLITADKQILHMHGTPPLSTETENKRLQEWKERAVKAERNAAYWQHYANEKDDELKTYYEMRLSQEIERAKKAEAEKKRLRELLKNSDSLLEEFNSDFANGQISIHHWQRQYAGAKQ